MDCWHCKTPAVGTCRFCGRGVCADHLTERTYILEVYKGADSHKAIVVPDALYCGACHPRPDPVDMPELDQS